jgi:hypothetical protein
VHTHLAGNVCKYFVTIFEFYPEHSVRQSLGDSALDFDGAVFFGQKGLVLPWKRLSYGIARGPTSDVTAIPCKT